MQVIWEVGTGKALCGSPMSASAVAFFNRDSERLATCGIDSSMHIWQLDRAARKMTAISVQLGLCRRNFTILDISEDDRYLYVGSTSGDVAEVRTRREQRQWPHYLVLVACQYIFKSDIGSQPKPNLVAARQIPMHSFL